jgi:hypothetical protein
MLLELTLLLCLFVSALLAQCTEVQPGLVIMELASKSATGFTKRTPSVGYNGPGYLEWTAASSFSRIPSGGVFSFTFNVAQGLIF